jgi:hypothetical protein
MRRTQSRRQAEMACTSDTPVSNLSTVPFDINEPLVVRDVTLVGDKASAGFTAFADHAALADICRVSWGRGRPIILMSERMWNRILLGAKAAKANGEPARQPKLQA